MTDPNATTELQDSRMSFGEHLADLRKRLFYSIIVVVIATLVCFNYAEYLFTWLRGPLDDILNVQMVVLDPLEMFITYLKLAFVAGLFVSIPWVLLQVWLFVAPGLYARERRWLLPFVFLGSLFFVGGGAFAFYVVMPIGFNALVALVPEWISPTYSVAKYFSLVTRLLIAFGVVFELPLVMWVLSAAGIASPDTFAKLRKFWIVIAVAIGALLTPPDPFTQLLMAIPLVLFFEIGILGARVLYPESRKAQKSEVA